MTEAPRRLAVVLDDLIDFGLIILLSVVPLLVAMTLRAEIDVAVWVGGAIFVLATAGLLRDVCTRPGRISRRGAR